MLKNGKSQPRTKFHTMKCKFQTFICKFHYMKCRIHTTKDSPDSTNHFLSLHWPFLFSVRVAFTFSTNRFTLCTARFIFPRPVRAFSTKVYEKAEAPLVWRLCYAGGRISHLIIESLLWNSFGKVYSFVPINRQSSQVTLLFRIAVQGDMTLW